MRASEQNEFASSRDDGTLSFFEIVRLVFKRKRLVLAIVSVCWGIGTLYIFTAKNLYMTSFELSPVRDEEYSKFSSVLGSLLGADSKLSVKNEVIGDFTYFLTSTNVAQVLMEDPRIVKTVFMNEWNEGTGSWQPPKTFFFFLKRIIFGIFGMPSYAPPSAYRLSQVLSKKVKVEQVPGSSTYIVSILGGDREFSEYLLDHLYKRADALLRLQRVEAMKRSVVYVKDKSETTSSVIHQRSLFNLLSYYEHQLLLLETDQPFAAVRLGPATSSDLPVSPRIPVVFLICLAVGLLASIAWILLDHQNRQKTYLRSVGQA